MAGWDGEHASQERILQFCDEVMAEVEAPQGVLL